MPSTRPEREPHELVRAFHRGEIDATEAELDRALGLPARAPSSALFEDDELIRRHPGESFADLPTPYDVARGVFQALALRADDVFYDLGCGVGRVVLYGAAVSDAHLVGIEIVEERVAVGRAALRATGLPHAEIVAGSVMDHALSRATVFYLSRPFGDETEARVMVRLAAEARRRDIRVVTHRIRPGRLDPEALEATSTGVLGIFRSRR